MSCGTGDAGGFFFRGHGYVLHDRRPGAAEQRRPGLPVPLEPVILGGIV